MFLAIPPTDLIPMTVKGLDFNDPATLDAYSELLLFQHDSLREELPFVPQSSKVRSIIHRIAEKLGLYSSSVGEGTARYIVVTKNEPVISQVRCSILYCSSLTASTDSTLIRSTLRLIYRRRRHLVRDYEPPNRA
jgi:hypothetical protein